MKIRRKVMPVPAVPEEGNSRTGIKKVDGAWNEN
jgi:hypothetical protein